VAPENKSENKIVYNGTTHRVPQMSLWCSQRSQAWENLPWFWKTFWEIHFPLTCPDEKGSPSSRFFAIPWRSSCLRQAKDKHLSGARGAFESVLEKDNLSRGE